MQYSKQVTAKEEHCAATRASKPKESAAVSPKTIKGLKREAILQKTTA